MGAVPMSMMLSKSSSLSDAAWLSKRPQCVAGLGHGPVDGPCAFRESALPHSFANADHLCGRALLTLHMATPVEAAMAALGSHLLQHIVATATAQAAAATWPGAALDARAAVGAGGAQAWVRFTKIRRGLIENKVLGQAGAVETWTEGSRVAVVWPQEYGMVHPLPQIRGHIPKLRGCHPACAELTAP